MAQYIYEKLDQLLILCNEITDDIKRRVVDNPDMVEQMENQWLFEIISRIPDETRINHVKEKLIQFDNETKYNK